MSFVSAQKSRVLIGDLSYSARLITAAPKWSANMLEVTTLADTAKQFILGQDTSTTSFEGLFEDATQADLASWVQGRNPISYFPSGSVLGSEAWMIDANQSSYTTKAGVSGAIGFDIEAQTTGTTEMGRSIFDLAAVTIDTNHPSYDQTTVSTTAGAVAHLHVTAFSGFSGVVFTIEDSANNSVWANIGTFTTVAGVTAERLVISGTIRRYVRLVTDVTGSGSVTVAASFSRR